MPQPTTFSALEIHSDAVNLSIVALTAENSPEGVETLNLKLLERISEAIDLSSEIAHDGKIGVASFKKLEVLVRRYAKMAHRNSARVVAMATGSFTRTDNIDEILKKLGGPVGVPIRRFSPKREADLATSAILNRFTPNETQLIIDAGSAFTYVGLTAGQKIIAETLLPIGTTGLSAVLVGDPPGALSWSLLASKVGFVLKSLPEGRPVRAFATGSTAQNLVGLDRKDDIILDRPLCMPDLHVLANELMAMPIKKLARRRAEDPRRVAILPPGLIIVSSILEYYGLDETMVIAEGIREGAIRAFALDPANWWQDTEITNILTAPSMKVESSLVKSA
jgi:exopolyphosphatase/pppGpp-phosphohydrolase